MLSMARPWAPACLATYRDSAAIPNPLFVLMKKKDAQRQQEKGRHEQKDCCQNYT